jgi:hypothetical protein
MARHDVTVVATLQRPDGVERLSLIRDISETGARMLVASRKVSVGDVVHLSLWFQDGGKTHVAARLLRVGAAECGGPWASEVAVQFDANVPLSGHALS